MQIRDLYKYDNYTSVMNAKTLFGEWLRCYRAQDTRSGCPDITLSAKECEFDSMRTSVEDYSRLLTFVCDRLAEHGAVHIDAVMKRRDKRIYLTLCAKVSECGIYNDGTELGESLPFLRLDSLCGVCENARTVMSCRSFSGGEVQIEFEFNRVDIGTLGFKAHTFSYYVLFGIKRAREDQTPFDGRDGSFS